MEHVDFIAFIVVGIGLLVFMILNQQEVIAHGRTKLEICRLQRQHASCLGSNSELPDSEMDLALSSQPEAEADQSEGQPAPQ